MSTTLDVSAAGRSADWSRFRTLLENHRADCLRERDAVLAELAQSVPDPVAQSRSSILQRTLAEIEAALTRLDEGTYGRCVHCAAAIPEERLELRPFAGQCVTCAAAR